MDVEKSLRLVGAGMNDTKIVSAAPGHVVQFNGPGVLVAEGITYEYLGEQSANVLVVKDGIIFLRQDRFIGAVSGEGGGGSGLVFSGDSNGLIQESDASFNSFGIFVTGPAQLVLEMSTCSDNRWGGIVYQDESSGQVRGNFFARNGRIGIDIHSEARLLLESNGLYDHYGEGIIFFGQASGIARRNEVSGNDGGIIVHEQAEPTLEENYITDNRGTGIWYQGENGGTARGNDCFRNGAGIVVAGQSKPSLEENVCRNNVHVGIEFRDQSGGIAKENECSANKVGIRLANDANPELIDNYCHDNTEEDLLDERS